MTTPTGTEKSARRRASRIGVVTKDKMEKSVVVRVDRTIKHDLYKRYIRRASRFMAHDENNACAVGDQVRIIEHRPLSKMKRWKVQATIQPIGVVGRT